MFQTGLDKFRKMIKKKRDIWLTCLLLFEVTYQFEMS